MSTDKKPRKGTIAHYRARVAELANENAALKSAAYDATVGELVCQMRATIATERAEQAERERDGETARADRLSAALTRITARHGQQATALCRAREDLAEETRTVEILTADLDRSKSRADGLANQNAALWSAVNDASAGALMFQSRADGLARHLARVRDLLAFTRGRLSEARINRDEYRESAKLRGEAADRWRDESATLYAELTKAKAAYASARIRCDELAGQVMALQVQLGATQVQAASLVDHLTLARRNFKAVAVVAVVVALTLAAVVVYV